MSKLPRICATVVISGKAAIAKAVEAIKLGTVGYLRKPVDPLRVKQILGNLAENVAIREARSD